MNFKDYKSRRKNVSGLINKIKDANEKKKKDYTDDRQYKYTKDKTGNAYAVIRFLPSKNDLPPVISTFKHGFQHRGRWFIEDCPTTIKQKCPVCESNNYFWREGATESDKQIGRQRARQKKYYSNIYIIKDSEQPDLEGKVMIWRYGQKIYEKIMEKLQPKFEDEQPVDIFDLFEGSSFRLKIKTVAGYSNYDNCEFSESGPLFDDDSKLEKVYNSIYDLSEFVDPKNFKSYDEIKQKHSNIVGDNTSATTVEERIEESEPKKVEKKEPVAVTSSSEPIESDSDEDDDGFWDDLTDEN